jgi:hypothetical protein
MSPAKPNPQGKGVVPILRDWATMQTGTLCAKSPADFLRDYCISSMVLSATFRFKPVVDKTYFLYATEQGLSLSMIAPHEWEQYDPEHFLANCRLRTDMTWAMDIPKPVERSYALIKARSYIRNFMTTLAEQNSICENLPFYIAELPYYQRMLATSLSSSLQRSLPNTGNDVKALLREQPRLSSMSAYCLPAA